MDQFVTADWSGHMDMGGAFTPSCSEGDGLDELLWCRGHVAMHSQPSPPVRQHEAAPWFQYPVVNDPLDKGLFSEIFGEMPADGGCRVTGSDTTGYSAPPRRTDAVSYNDTSTTVTSSSMRPKPPGAASRSSVKRKQSNTSESPGEVLQNAEDPDSATTRGPAQRTSTGKRRRAAQEHNLSERRRRDRINEKMRALQELVPHCNKTDKVSMLDEAIQYLKSLQLQVQMMWTTGGSMAPASAMFPASGAHRYMERMAATHSRMPPFRTCVYSSLNGKKKLSYEPSS